jgi:hypothetical protein
VNRGATLAQLAAQAGAVRTVVKLPKFGMKTAHVMAQFLGQAHGRAGPSAQFRSSLPAIQAFLGAICCGSQPVEKNVKNQEFTVSRSAYLGRT